ncbi:TPA: hypothetical protein KEV27_000905 [Escherichia coli]|nr:MULTISPECIES: hypothetical protein [Escherichia]EFW7446139.1 hypothetical protein [Shigella sonnei]EEQ9035318.1 hypothetical protein [Escherichia coli]EEU4612629.1 hypothetical protein [Escherichia coli]EEW1633501.1 hypothetical protein [Escherichia coli]EEY5086318.1 hypothetical protein [Escherichia coli]
MNIDMLRKALSPKLVKIEVEGVELYIHRPTLKTTPECTSIEKVLVHCVKDENGNPVFSDSGLIDLIDVNEIDKLFAEQIYMKVLGLITVDDVIDSTEKK